MPITFLPGETRYAQDTGGQVGMARGLEVEAGSSPKVPQGGPGCAGQFP